MFEVSQESKGFVKSNLYSGLSISEHFFASIGARWDLICKSILTAKYGDWGWEVRQFLESFINSNNRFVQKTVSVKNRTSSNTTNITTNNTTNITKKIRILQSLYGYHGFDDWRLTSVKIQKIFTSLSDHHYLKELAEHYINFANNENWKYVNIFAETDEFRTFKIPICLHIIYPIIYDTNSNQTKVNSNTSSSNKTTKQ